MTFENWCAFESSPVQNMSPKSSSCNFTYIYYIVRVMDVCDYSAATNKLYFTIVLYIYICSQIETLLDIRGWLLKIWGQGSDDIEKKNLEAVLQGKKIERNRTEVFSRGKIVQNGFPGRKSFWKFHTPLPDH